MRRAPEVLVIALALAGCGEGNPGFDPPSDELSFPSGLLLDPRVTTEALGPCTTDDECDSGQLCGAGQCRAAPRWLFVTNANSDRRFNSGSLLAVDLERVWAEAFEEPGRVRPAGARLDDDRPCRRVANLPQVVECIEEPFIADRATVHFGNFPGPTVAWDEDRDDDEALLFVPVRGDPSVTFLELSGGLDGDDLRFECGQDSDSDGRRRCADRYRLRFLRNDPDAARVSREPFRMFIDDEFELAYITHQRDPDVTLMALDGLAVGGDGRPAIVDQANVFEAEHNLPGGFGIARRPCDVDSGNAPSVTLGCSRPLIYGSYRWRTATGFLAMSAFTAVEHDPLESQVCVGPDELDEPGALICEAQAERVTSFVVSGLSTIDVPLAADLPHLADVAFSATGDQLYVVQTNPGALLRIDTSIDVDGEPVNLTNGRVEVCSQPTSMVIYDDGENAYALVTCYRSAELFIVDLASFSVAGLTRAGIGPDALAVDLAREVVYVGNSLDETVSIIDMARDSSTRFTEIGRVGLQEPYTQ